MQQVLMKQCLTCGQVIRGRSDKKFCHDGCRNQYHNLNMNTVTASQRVINSLLRKNRRILLHALLPDQTKCRCKKTILENRGFHFGFFTHTRSTRKGHTSFFCYEFGYQLLSGDAIRVFRDDIIGKEDVKGFLQ
jgi:hypothetical protein